MTLNHNEKSIHDNLNRLCQKTGYRIFQKPAYRIFAPASGPIWDWPHETEVYVNNMPEDMAEDLIYAQFSMYGNIRQIRIPLTTGGKNKQFAYILYEKKEEAWRAVDNCNGRELKFLRGQFVLNVNISDDNRRLFVGPIPRLMTKEQIHCKVEPLTPGLLKVIIYKDFIDPQKNRGFCFLEYRSHREANAAKVKLNSVLIHQGFQECRVNWANPEPFVHPVIMDSIKTIFIRGLKQMTTREYVMMNVCYALCISHNLILECRRNSGYAFITFIDRTIALRAVELLDGISIDGSQIEVTIARPHFLNFKCLPANHPNVFCVPKAYHAKGHAFKENDFKPHELFPTSPGMF